MNLSFGSTDRAQVEVNLFSAHKELYHALLRLLSMSESFFAQFEAAGGCLTKMHFFKYCPLMLRRFGVRCQTSIALLTHKDKSQCLVECLLSLFIVACPSLLVKHKVLNMFFYAK